MSATTHPDIEIDAESDIIRVHDDVRRLVRERMWWLGLSAVAIIFLAVMFALGGVEGRGLWKLIFVGPVAAFLIWQRVETLSDRLHDKDPDLILSPEGLEDRWLGMGVIPWRYVSVKRGLPPRGRRLFRSGDSIYLKTGPLDDWFGTMPDKKWLNKKIAIERADNNGGLVALSKSGGDTLAMELDDLLWLLGRYTKVEGLPEGYAPKHPKLQALAMTMVPSIPKEIA